MSEYDSISRIEDRGNRLAVITKSWHDISYRDQNVLTRDYPDLYTYVSSKDTVRVGTAAHPDTLDEEKPFEIHGVNTVYAEVPLVERELTDSEINWCEDTIMYSGDKRPETVFEFEIPHPEDLRNAILSESLDAFEELTARNPDHDARHEIVTELQTRLEEERLRQCKLDWLRGYPVDLLPEWDPENSHNDGRDADHLNDMAGMRSDTHMYDFELVTGINYYAFLTARVRHLGIHEPHIEDTKLLALGVAGAPHLSYCRQCGGVLPEDQFLHVQRRGREEGRTLRVCDDCADTDHTNRFTEEAVNTAKDNRVKRIGGQRRLTGIFDSTDDQP